LAPTRCPEQELVSAISHASRQRLSPGLKSDDALSTQRVTIAMNATERNFRDGIDSIPIAVSINIGTKEDTRYRVTSIGVTRYDPASRTIRGKPIQRISRTAASRCIRQSQTAPMIANSANSGNGRVPSPL